MSIGFFANFTCWPPLGRLTVLDTDTAEVGFVVRLGWGLHGGQDVPWEVEVCHRSSSTGGLKSANWNYLRLSKSDDRPLDVGKSGQDEVEAFFHGKLPLTSFKSEGSAEAHEAFTVRYRVSSIGHWHYAGQEFNYSDGEIIKQKPLTNPRMDDYIAFASDWKSTELEADEDATSFLLESASSIPKSKETPEQPFHEVNLGQLKGHARWFAVGRYQPMWLGPRQGGKNFLLSEPALQVSFLMETGHHLTLVGFNGLHGIQTQLRSTEGDNVVVSTRHDGDGESSYRVYAGIALDIESSIAAAMDAARDAVASTNEIEQTKSKIASMLAKNSSSIEDLPKPDDWFDGLAFCTWNSLGVDLTPDAIVGALDSLTSRGIFPTTLIIDDNWQTISDYRKNGRPRHVQGMERFEANSEFFPNGLKDAVSNIRAKNPYLENVAVWHALMGYWGGIAPGSELTEKYKATKALAYLIDSNYKPQEMTAIHPSDIARWYDDFYAWLSSCGVNGVKTDVQCQLDILTESESRVAFSEQYQAAWTAAHLRHFQGKAISCMSMTPQILFHQFLPTNAPKLMLRNSDDFYPEHPSSHALHVFVNAHNSLFTRNLNALPDWDMFQTRQEWGSFHGAARCLSGGPLYVTDPPGETDVELVNQMTGLSPARRTISVRPDDTGRSLFAYESFAERHVLRIGNTHKSNGLLGLFNTSDSIVRYFVPFTDIPAVKPGRQYLVRSHNSGQIFGPITDSVSAAARLIKVKLPVRGYEILTAVPVTTLSKGSVAVLGLLGKMTGVAAVTRMSVNEEGGQIKIELSLKALGRLGIWLDGVKGQKVEAKLEGKPIGSVLIEHSEGNDNILQINILEAWAKLKAEGESRAEVKVEVAVGSS